MIRAAGVMFLCGDQALFVKRSDTGEWAFPGGHIEAGETAEEAAEREVREELGPTPHGLLRPHIRRVRDDGAGEVDFTTFVGSVQDEFVPSLNDEHTGYAWASVQQPPEPLHPGVRVALARLTMNELDVARAMAAGDLASPQRYGGFWLWKIRITGTELAWRGAKKDEKTGKIIRDEEFCWRDKSIYLTPEFLARCNGLPVTFIHSEGKTDSKEWSQRAVGTVFVPFIEDEEVWSIAKVYDDDANAILLNKQFSSSPTVFFGPEGSGTTVEMDGSKLLIENKPALLDSIALVPLGVWDKGGPPVGVQNDTLNPSSESQETVRMADEDKRDDAAKMDAKLDAIMDSLKSAHSRMDAMEADSKARKDAEEKEREEREDKARKDAARKDRCDKHRADRFGSRKDGECHADWAKRHDADEEAMCDAMRKDGAEEEEAREDARSARKDAEDKERADGGESFEKWASEESEEHKDKKDARKDGEDKPEEEEMKPDARHDAAAGEIAELKRQLAAMKSEMGARFTPVTPEERNALATAQARADGVAGLFGKRASGPIPGESSLEYRRRVAGDFKQHSARFKDVTFDGMTPATFATIEEIIYADAAFAARSGGENVGLGILIPIKEQDASGRTITRYTGDNMSWMAPFMSSGRVGRFVDPRKQRI